MSDVTAVERAMKSLEVTMVDGPGPAGVLRAAVNLNLEVSALLARLRWSTLVAEYRTSAEQQEGMPTVDTPSEILRQSADDFEAELKRILGAE
jgi:hypothetical protein